MAVDAELRRAVVPKIGLCWAKKKEISLLGQEEEAKVGKYLGA